ncbi:MAG: hypothetical protein PWP25_1961 [Sphaerochaeta sp.]|jgi:hypothetical protein|nr:hypothetical protein [Sphaerochaeta sp.]
MVLVILYTHFHNLSICQNKYKQDLLLYCGEIHPNDAYSTRNVMILDSLWGNKS